MQYFFGTEQKKNHIVAMDERTLEDLLECSVCLEQLDQSSKVLPCQHTFCRKCLEVRYIKKRNINNTVNLTFCIFRL